MARDSNLGIIECTNFRISLTEFSVFNSSIRNFDDSQIAHSEGPSNFCTRIKSSSVSTPTLSYGVSAT